jgi:hypothetical protein
MLNSWIKINSEFKSSIARIEFNNKERAHKVYRNMETADTYKL